MAPPDLLMERWYRLFVAVACGVLGAIGALMIAGSVHLEGTGGAHDWFLFCSMFCGAALGFPIGAALYTHVATITTRVRLPRAWVVRARR
jgi:hypothetical protein